MKTNNLVFLQVISLASKSTKRLLIFIIIKKFNQYYLSPKAIIGRKSNIKEGVE